MVIQAKIKISEKDNAPPRTNVHHVLKGMQCKNVSLIREGNSLCLGVVLPTKEDLFLLKRKLGAKKNRPWTVVEIMEYVEL